MLRDPTRNIQICFLFSFFKCPLFPKEYTLLFLRLKIALYYATFLMVSFRHEMKIFDECYRHRFITHLNDLH